MCDPSLRPAPLVTVAMSVRLMRPLFETDFPDTVLSDNFCLDTFQCDNLVSDGVQCDNFCADNFQCDNLVTDGVQCDNSFLDTIQCNNLVTDAFSVTIFFS